MRIFSKIRWPQNLCKILRGFWSEFQPFRWLWNSSSRILTKSAEYGFFLELDDHRIFIKFFKDSDQNSNLSIQPFRWLWNSSIIRWPQNSHIRFQGFWSEYWGALWVGIGGCEYWCVFQDFGLNARKENLNPKKRERELYSRLKRTKSILSVHCSVFTT